MALYHFTPELEFTVFDRGDTGFHFGSWEQAQGRRSKMYTQQGRVFRVYLDIQHPYYARSDIGSWKAPGLAMLLWSDGILTEAEYNKIVSLKAGNYHAPAETELRKLLREKGYDGVVYPNAIEGKGPSYMVLDNSQILQTQIIPVR